jgi:hypothetical protein
VATTRKHSLHHMLQRTSSSSSSVSSPSGSSSATTSAAAVSAAASMTGSSSDSIVTPIECDEFVYDRANWTMTYTRYAARPLPEAYCR